MLTTLRKEMIQFARDKYEKVELEEENDFKKHLEEFQARQ